MTGTPDEVTKALPGKVFSITCPQPNAAYAALRGRWASTNLLLLGDCVRLWAPDGEADARACLDLLHQQELGPANFEEVEPSLQDAFVGLLGVSAAATGQSQAAEPSREG